MSLFNKYRPKTIEDVIGQPQVTNKLKSLLCRDNKPQVFFLCGESGTGKTTTANIIKHAFIGDDEDNFYQYDMAENSKIEDVRAIQDSLKYKPMFGDYNVVLLDEVHNISKKSFDLFLVPTEEENSHNVYIFSTTEGDKVSDTIKSRGIELDFRGIQNNILGPHIMSIAEKEGKPIEKRVAKAILDRAQGNVRLSLSLLEGCIDIDCSNAQIESVGGSTLSGDSDTLKDLFNSLTHKSSWGDISKLILKLEKEGEQPESIRKRFLAWVTNAMLNNYKPKLNSHMSDCLYNFKESFAVDGRAKLVEACYLSSNG